MAYVSRQLSAGCGCDDPSQASQLISIDEAFKRISRSVHAISGTEMLPINAARGRVLSSTVCARSDMPRFDHAAMDGYALDSTALSGEGPWLLSVNGRIAAGDAHRTECVSLEACRIFTGAPLPDKFDCVVMQERVENLGDMIRLITLPTSGENVRRRGEECRAGSEIIPAGNMLTSRAIAACASAGHDSLEVQKTVRVALIATGSEIATLGIEQPKDGAIWDVNTPMLQSLLSRPDAELFEVAKVNDTEEIIQDSIQSAAANADLIITTGGVSVGDEDHLHAAVNAAGGHVIFAGVAIKPGKPIALGRIGSAIWLGLPGNPGSAFVTWSIFGEAILQALSGRMEEVPKRRHVLLRKDLSRKAGRCEIRAARIAGVDGLGREIIECKSGGNSGQVSHYASADGLAFLPSEMDQIPAGSLIEFLPFCTN